MLSMSCGLMPASGFRLPSMFPAPAVVAPRSLKWMNPSMTYSGSLLA